MCFCLSEFEKLAGGASQGDGCPLLNSKRQCSNERSLAAGPEWGSYLPLYHREGSADGAAARGTLQTGGLGEFVFTFWVVTPAFGQGQTPRLGPDGAALS